MSAAQLCTLVPHHLQQCDVTLIPSHMQQCDVILIPHYLQQCVVSGILSLLQWYDVTLILRYLQQGDVTVIILSKPPRTLYMKPFESQIIYNSFTWLNVQNIWLRPSSVAS